MGNLAERYELSSIKSAGVSLLRVMAPLFLLTLGIGAFSYFCNDTLIPISNLKFKSRLYDIRKQKPTLSIEERLFNDDFGDVVIRVDEKLGEDGNVEGVLIYDHNATNENRLSEISAKRGRMYTTEDGKFFVMDLEEGSQYNELKPTFNDGKQNYPFVRTNFKEWSKVFDMSEFEIEGTDEKLFRSHHTMLSTRQLAVAVDSIDGEIEKRKKNYNDYLEKHITILKETEEKGDSTEVGEKKDSSIHNIPISVAKQAFQPPQQLIEKDLKEYDSFVDLLYKDEQMKHLTKAKAFIRGVMTQSKATQSSLIKTEERKVKHIFEMHSKFNIAFACVIFLFIGAPMGAIVRKGGFGYPILISIIFFIFFVTLNIMFKKLAESGSIHAALAAWMPCIVMIPIGIVLTIKAMNDSTFIDWSRLKAFFQNIFRRKKSEGVV